MAPVHTVTSKKEVVVYEPPQSRSQTTSRWDALLRESDTGASSTRQRRPLATNRGRCHASHHWGQVGEQPGGKFRTDSNGGNRSNWRRPPASDDSSSPGRSAEDAAVIEALDQVRDSINTYLHDKRDKYGDGEECSTFVHRSIEQLAASIFQEIDTTTILIEIPCHHLLINVNSTKQSLPNVSTAVIWKAGYSLLQQVHLLSESSHSCYQLIHFLSFVALHCLRSVTSNRQPEIIIISTADACECLSMLVGILGCHIFENNNLSGNNNNNTEDDAVKCKNTLMACMAVMLSFSTKKSGAPPGKDKKKIDIPPSLLPWGAEKTVHVVLKETALPFLKLLMKENDGVLSSCSSENIIYCYEAMECLYILLRDPKWETNFDAIVPAATSQLSKYASAILAPLIVDILPDGKEKQHTNPLRSKTLMAVCNFWDWSYEYINEKKSPSDEEAAYRKVILLMACKCMAAAVNALAALRKSKSQNAHDVPREINVNTIVRQLQSMFRSDELRSYRPKFLSIMSLLCLAYPSASANQWHIFIEQSSTNEALLLSIMDSGAVALNNGDFEDECWIALPNALHAASALLTAMPFSLWISGEARSLTRMSGGNFASRIRTALLGVMHCICNLMLAVKARICIPSLSDPSTEIVMRLVSDVAGKLCTILPFSGDNMLLLHPAVRIMQCAGDIYVDSVSAELHEPTMHSSLCSKAISTFGSVIIESLGTCSVASDTESISTISAPATAWLSSASSYDFIGLLLTDSRWPCPSSRERMDMLSALAKGSPSTLVREPFNLASFCEVCTYQSQNGSGLNSRTQGLQLIESFIYGRKASIECSSNSAVDVVIRQTFRPILLTALEDSSATIRTCAVSSFGSLLQRDWMECIDASTIDNAPLGSILRLCSAKNENVASVRAASCKAIGDIFISCTDGTLHHAKNSSDDSVSLGDGFILTYSCMVCEEMRNALDDKAASVRSMALYALGNTALALKEQESEVSIVPTIKDMFLSVCACLDDCDDKVVANAIRSISHSSYFVYSPSYFSITDSDALVQFKDLLDKLSAKVNSSLDDAVCGPTTGLTWKQRSGAKKQTRGSCITLGVLLNYSNILQNVDDATLEISLSSLFRCIQLSCQLDDKIVAAAISSLLGLSSVLWRQISCKYDSIGRGLATLFHSLEKEKSRTQSHNLKIECLAISLLDLATETDLCQLFLIGEESIPFSIVYFYQWLVAHDVKLNIYETIAAAVSSDSVSRILDVSVVQMFLSRTIRQQHSPRKVANVDPTALDEGDEL